jgi:hypothetical protein
VKRALTLSLPLAVLFVSAPSAAQLHYDVGAEVGTMRRILLKRDPNLSGTDATFGPDLELHAHVAVLPMLRAGIYVGHDMSPEKSLRQITSFGLRAKLMPPILCGNWRAWAFAGIGYSIVYSPSYHATYQIPTPTNPNNAQDVAFDGESGQFLEVPLGIGLGYKLRKPWELTAELGTKIGFGFSDNLYNAAGGTGQGYPQLEVTPIGYDTLAVYLLVGVSLDL